MGQSWRLTLPLSAPPAAAFKSFVIIKIVCLLKPKDWIAEFGKISDKRPTWEIQELTNNIHFSLFSSLTDQLENTEHIHTLINNERKYIPIRLNLKILYFAIFFYVRYNFLARCIYIKCILKIHICLPELLLNAGQSPKPELPFLVT